MAEIDLKTQIQQQWEAAQQMLPSRTIIFDAAITEDTAARLIGHLLLLERLSQEPIILVIRSHGGQVYAGLSIYDTLRCLTVPVIAIVDTIAAGNALLFLLASDQRYALPNSQLVYIPIMALDTKGTGSDLVIQSLEVQRLSAIHTGSFQQHIATLKHPNPVWRLFKRPGWDLGKEHRFSTQQALEYNLIDAVVENVEAIARQFR